MRLHGDIAPLAAETEAADEYAMVDRVAVRPDAALLGLRMGDGAVRAKAHRDRAEVAEGRPDSPVAGLAAGDVAAQRAGLGAVLGPRRGQGRGCPRGLHQNAIAIARVQMEFEAPGALGAGGRSHADQDDAGGEQRDQGDATARPSPHRTAAARR